MVLGRLKSLVGLNRGWDDLLAEARRTLFQPTDAETAQVIAKALAEAPAAHKLRGKAKAQARVYRALALWRADGHFERPFDTETDGRVQFWDLEHNCAVFGFQKRMAQELAAAFPKLPGLRKNLNILEHTSDVAPDVQIDQTEALSMVETPGAERTIIAFSGLTNICLGVGWTTFYRAAAYPARANLIVLRDFSRQLHLGGNAAFGDHEATVRGLTDLTTRFAQRGEVIGLGASGGTFGGLATLTRVPGIERFVALSGPTSLAIGGEHENKQVYAKILAEIEAGRLPDIDLPGQVNASALRRIDFLLSAQNAFDVRQMEHLRDRSDVLVAHPYPTALHSMTDLCVADGKLVRLLEGGEDR